MVVKTVCLLMGPITVFSNSFIFGWTTVLCLEVHLGMAGDFIWLWLSVGCETISFFHRSGMVRLFFC